MSVCELLSCGCELLSCVTASVLYLRCVCVCVVSRGVFCARFLRSFSIVDWLRTSDVLIQFVYVTCDLFHCTIICA